MDDKSIKENNSTVYGKGPIYDQLIDELLSRKMYFIDKRHKGGGLWIFGGRSLKSLLAPIEKQYQVKFHYADDGCKTTDGLSAWWTSKVVPLKTGQAIQWSYGCNLRLIVEKSETKEKSVREESVSEESGQQAFYTANRSNSITDDDKPKSRKDAIISASAEARNKRFVKWLEHKYPATEVTEKINSLNLLREYLKEKKQMEFYQIQLSSDLVKLIGTLEADVTFELRYSKKDARKIFSVLDDYKLFLPW